MTNILITSTITAACLVFGQAHASGPSIHRIEPEVIAPDCVSWFGLFPCHEGFKYINPEGGKPFDPQEPKPTPCSSLDVPGAVLANGGKGKQCA